MSQNPARHLSAAAEGIRSFNHTSRSTGEDWQYPGHAYDAIGNLSYLVGMLAQAVKQSTVPVTHAYKQDRILIDGGGSANAKVAEMRAAREEAAAAAMALTAAVQRMHNAVSPMGLDTTGLPEFEDDDEDA
ncbi:hypothetical protein PWY87_35770 [Kribbella solani]|uniref:Uncharacterized protein n=1 Tax=Streptomyces acidiscabies TaxID=42234 RepID=A0ABU4MDE7_9ACTN|nr:MULTISPECIES: hypothetical protein [Actinomycetes]MDX2973815.1 hypothetical protein [Kribbella solani]MDX3007076.1 hypothetical protein [Kribbella solani]MDX3026141.1 hypothetical protein [Streptomyces acidiscabies]